MPSYIQSHTLFNCLGFVSSHIHLTQIIFFLTPTHRKKKIKPSVIEERHHHHQPHLLTLSQTDHRINALKCFSDY